MLNTLPPSPVPPPPLPPARRRRGGQPSNRNSLKHGLYAIQRPSPLRRYSNSFAGYQQVLEEKDPASLERSIRELHKQIDLLVGLLNYLLNQPTLSLYLALFPVFMRTISFSRRMKVIHHHIQQPFHDLIFVASRACDLIAYDFREHSITHDADSFLKVSEKSYLNSAPSWASLCPPFSEPDFPFLTPRQWQVLQPLIPPAHRASTWDGSPPSLRGRHPADPHEIIDAIFWKVAHHARWQDLPVGYPSMAVCRRYYRRIFRSGRLFTLYRHLYKDLCTRGRLNLTTWVKRGCFMIQGNKVVLRPGLPETWRMRTALLFMQQGYAMFRHLRYEKVQERRRRFPSFRLFSKRPLRAQPERKEEEFHFTLPCGLDDYSKYVLPPRPAHSPVKRVTE